MKERWTQTGRNGGALKSGRTDRLNGCSFARRLRQTSSCSGCQATGATMTGLLIYSIRRSEQTDGLTMAAVSPQTFTFKDAMDIRQTAVLLLRCERIS